MKKFALLLLIAMTFMVKAQYGLGFDEFDEVDVATWAINTFQNGVCPMPNLGTNPTETKDFFVQKFENNLDFYYGTPFYHIIDKTQYNATTTSFSCEDVSICGTNKDDADIVFVSSHGGQKAALLWDTSNWDCLQFTGYNLGGLTGGTPYIADTKLAFFEACGYFGGYSKSTFSSLFDGVHAIFGSVADEWTFNGGGYHSMYGWGVMIDTWFSNNDPIWTCYIRKVNHNYNQLVSYGYPDEGYHVGVSFVYGKLQLTPTMSIWINGAMQRPSTIYNGSLPLYDTGNWDYQDLYFATYIIGTPQY